MARASITRRLAATALLAALSLGWAAPPAATFGIETAGAANGKGCSQEVCPEGIAWK